MEHRIHWEDREWLNEVFNEVIGLLMQINAKLGKLTKEEL